MTKTQLCWELQIRLQAAIVVIWQTPGRLTTKMTGSLKAAVAQWLVDWQIGNPEVRMLLAAI